MWASSTIHSGLTGCRRRARKGRGWSERPCDRDWPHSRPSQAHFCDHQVGSDSIFASKGVSLHQRPLPACSTQLGPRKACFDPELPSSRCVEYTEARRLPQLNLREHRVGSKPQPRKAVGQILGPGAIYFPVAGTLIGLMRHGRTVGSLTEGKIDVVDRDIDLYLVLPSAKAYLSFCFAMTQSLRRAGWLGCSLKWRQDWSQTTLPDVDEVFDFRRSFTLQCHLLGDQGDSLLEIKWLMPVISVPSPCPQNLTDALLPSLLENPHFDAISCCGGVRLMPKNINVSSVPRNVAITTGPIYCPAHSENCWSLATQFRKWKGVIPASVWNSRGRCRAYKGAVRCMRKSTLFLQTAGESDLYHAGGSCLALPDLACPGHVTEWPSGRSKSPENLRLTQGLTDADVHVLVSRMLEMRDSGFVTHNITDCDLRLCIRKITKLCSDECASSCSFQDAARKVGVVADCRQLHGHQV